MKEFQPGIIIRAPLHEEDFNRTKRFELPNMSSAKSSHISFSDRFGAIYSEDRFLIVVAAFSRHYLAIPLYTYAGTGLKHKDDPGEYASIVDHRQPNSAAESPHILRTAELKRASVSFRQAVSRILLIRFRDCTSCMSCIRVGWTRRIRRR
jgi:hypothetical protein